MTRERPEASYDDDFFAWTQDQAAALRRVAKGVLGESVDVSHVATEIEDLGKRDLREVTSYLALLLEHLIKIEGAPSSRDVPHWRGEAINFQASALAASSSSMRRALDIDDIWRLARRRVIAANETGLDLPILDRAPLGIDDMLDEAFDLDAALTKLASVRAASRDSA